MKSTRVRVILAVIATGVALTACSPSQVGAAAVVGGDRISSGELERNVREYEAALTKAGLSPAQLQFPGSVPQVVLYQLATARQYTKVAEKNGVTVTDGEVDQAINTQGGADQYGQQLLQQAVAPSQARAYTRARLMITKLMAKYGGGADQEALQRGQQRVVEDLKSVRIEWNPRYGKINAQPSQEQPQIFTAEDRFGKAPEAAPLQ
ncbi:SurA N-terminal domain-containing protein [Streptosporangium sp. NPDC004379]|uniref:SurA N-terminal domain-containing protein n=1 Tax=Streptosporangium sp. NPDC004379 TaxID=3366189 RepID=UPI003682B2EB